MVGLQTKYKMMQPECCLFVEEKSSIGGDCVRATSYIRFTVLCSTSGTAEPVMCAVTL